MTISTLFPALVHVAVLLVVPPLLIGVIAKTKAAFAGRSGPPLLQPYRDLAKLFRKDSCFSGTTTWIFRAGPVVSLGTALLAGLLVPFGNHSAPIGFVGDLVVFAYLLGLGRFFTTAAAFDTGSAFEGMGATRELTFSVLAEPALFFGFIVLARLSGSLQLGGLLAVEGFSGWSVAAAPLVLVAVAWFLVLLVENCRVPFDDPNTHLELTMIHEVMVLDHGGPLLGFVLWGAQVKLFVTGALLLRILLPVEGVSPALGWLLFLAGMILVAIAIGIVESTMARMRLLRIPQTLVTATLLAAFAVVLLMR
jgi:formate hydrogenlyase subunit 4